MDNNHAHQVDISIIIPIYNTEPYLAACLDSVLGQTFGNIEVICINDGSTDESPKIVEEYATRDSRIRVVNQANHGQAYARNKGVDISQGKYVYFMDSDDILKESALQMLYNIAEANNSDVVFFEGDSFFDSYDLEKKFYSYKFAYERFNGVEGITDGRRLLEWYEIYNKFVVSPCLIFVRRDFIRNNIIRFHNGIMYEDNIFHIRLLLELHNGYVLHEKLFNRRVRNESTMTTTTFRFKQLYSWFICYYDSLNLLPMFEKIGRKSCLALLLDSFLHNMQRVYNGLRGTMLNADDLICYKGMDILQRQMLNSLGVGVYPILSSVMKYCGDGKKIVIYGAGVIGINIYFFLNQSNCNHTIHIVDRAVAAIDDMPEVIVHKPCELPNIPFDLLIICVGNEALAKGIVKQLNNEYGINTDKVVWYGDIVDYVVGEAD